ncbi:MAG: hypothetical protein IJ217_00105 [Clostridia bacterium]|nr:hypothetical protein [Clostridia bacterium]
MTILPLSLNASAKNAAGYYQNKLVIDQMKESISHYPQTGYVEINTNINQDYAHTMGYENPNFLPYFYQYYHLSDIVSDVYYLLPDSDAKLYVNSKRTNYPPIFQNNNIYLPMRFVIEKLGGYCNWRDERTIYTLNNYYVVIDNETKKIAKCSIRNFEGTDLLGSIRVYLDREFININDICYLVGDNECKIEIK